jgi:hypothetical protein
MPIQRFRCPVCHWVGQVFYTAPAYDAAHNRITPWPRCPECRLDLVTAAAQGGTPLVDDQGRWTDAPELEPFPCTMQHDLLTGGTGLSVTGIDGAETTVSSLSEIRTIENESLRRAKNGDGSPIVFRGFSQNRTNKDKNTLAGSEFQRNKSEKIDITRQRTTRGLPITPRVIAESVAPKP